MSDQQVQNSLGFRNIGYQYLEQTQTMSSREHSIEISDEAAIITYFFKCVSNPSVKSLPQIIKLINIIFDIPKIQDVQQFMKALKARISWDIQKKERVLTKIQKQQDEAGNQIINIGGQKQENIQRKIDMVDMFDILEQKKKVAKNLLEQNHKLLIQFESFSQKIIQINEYKYNPYIKKIFRSNQGTNKKINIISSSQNKQETNKFCQNDPYEIYEMEMQKVKSKSKQKKSNKNRKKQSTKQKDFKDPNPNPNNYKTNQQTLYKNKNQKQETKETKYIYKDNPYGQYGYDRVRQMEKKKQSLELSGNRHGFESFKSVNQLKGIVENIKEKRPSVKQIFYSTGKNLRMLSGYKNNL